MRPICTIAPSMEYAVRREVCLELMNIVCVPILSALVCIQPMDIGDIESSMHATTITTRWYYNSATRSCHSFAYRGVNGNANNFETKDHCESYCLSRKRSHTSIVIFVFRFWDCERGEPNIDMTIVRRSNRLSTYASCSSSNRQCYSNKLLHHRQYKCSHIDSLFMCCPLPGLCVVKLIIKCLLSAFICSINGGIQHYESIHYADYRRLPYASGSNRDGQHESVR